MKNLIKIDTERKKELLIFLFFLCIPYIFYFNLLYSKGVWAAGDAIIQYIPWYKYLGEMIRNGSVLTWSDGINMGVPFFEAMPISVFYPLNWLVGIIDFEHFYNIFILFHFSLAGIFTYKYIKGLGYNRRIALICGLIYMFSGAIDSRRNHVNILHTIVWLPLVMYFYEKMFKSDKFRNIVYFAVTLAVFIYGGALQHYLYVAMIVAIFFFFKLYETDNRKKWLLKNVISISFSIIISLPIIIFMDGALNGSAKDVVDYGNFVSYSLPIKNLITFIFPYIFGVHIPNTPLPLYANGYTGGGNLSEFGLYVGILVFLGAIYVLLKEYKKDKSVFIWGIIFIVSVIFALGGSLPLISKVMFKIPAYNLFRVPARWLFISDFSLVVLFAKFLQEYIENREKLNKFIRYYVITSGIILWTICIIAILNKKNYISKESLVNIRFDNPSIWIPIVTMVVYYILFKIIQKLRKDKNMRWIYIVLSVVLVIDVWSYSFFHENVLMEPSKGNELAEEINKLNINHSRVWPVISASDYFLGGTGVDYNLYNNIRTVNGYFGMSSNSMQRKLGFDSRGINLSKKSMLSDAELLGKLDVQYLVVNKNDMETLNTLKAVSNEKLILEDSNISLKAMDETLSMYQNSISLLPNKNYKIEITLDNVDKKNEPILTVDFYGDKYDFAEQEFSISPQKDEFYGVVNSGTSIPDKTYLRIFTFNKMIDKEINKIRVYELDNQPNAYIYNVVYEDEQHMVFDIGNKYMVNKLFLEQDSNIFTNSDTQKINLSSEDMKYISGDISAKVSNDSGHKQTLIFNESYNKGWKGYIDGAEQEVEPINDLLVGMKIPEGEHMVEFKYTPYTLNLVIGIYAFAIIYIIACYKGYIIIKGKFGQK